LGVTGNVTAGNLTINGNISGNTAGFTIGYRDIPQVVFTSNATLALTDAGKHYFSSNSANVITIPNNTTVSFNIGTAISIIQQGTANLTVTPGSGVTLYLAGNSTSASRNVGNYGMATLVKVNTNTWFINGTGIT
jgi:NCAIR mutase (PurE)-related protein